MVKTPLQAFPRPARFHVQVEKGANRRCPTLILEPAPPPSKAGGPVIPTMAVASWKDGFLQELEGLFPPNVLAAMDRADQVALRFTLDELRQEPGPEDHAGLAPLLLAG